MDRDSNLLFGILAVQFKGVSPAQMVDAAAAWHADPSVPLGEYLVAQGALTPQDRAVVEHLVEEALGLSSGNVPEMHTLSGSATKSPDAAPESIGWDTEQTRSPLDSSHCGRASRETTGIQEPPGRYTLLSHHAKGGMGRVLLVHDAFLGRNIALKELLFAGAPSASPEKTEKNTGTSSVMNRFLQEARITGQLEHPSIVPVYELGRRDDGTPYYTMKLVKGKTLAQALRDCKDLNARLQLLPHFMDLCQAIAYAHSRSVIHRDIKPSNVMVGQFGETVVLDWGLAKRRDVKDVNEEDIAESLRFLEMDDTESLEKTSYGRALGTPQYMSPEQAEGRIEAIDERSDIYSLGAVLYEILTGATPFSGKNTRDVLSQVIQSDITPIAQAAPDAPPELAEICAKAMQRASQARYQSTKELVDDVHRFVTGRLVSVYSYSLREIFLRYYRKHKAAVNAAAVCLLSLAVVGIFSYINIWNARNREREQRLIAEEKTYLSQIHSAEALLSKADYAGANQVLWDTNPQRRAWEWGYLLNRANPERYTVETPGSSVHAAVYSPDGEKLLTLSSPDPAVLRNSQTGEPLVTLEGEVIYYTSWAFSPDESRVAVGGFEGLRVWDAETGTLVSTFNVPSGVFSIVFAADSAHVFTGCGERFIRGWDIASSEPFIERETASHPVYSLKFYAGNQRLMAGMGESGSGVVQVWSYPELTLLFTGEGMVPCISPDDTWIATAERSMIFLYDAETGLLKKKIDSRQDFVMELRFSKDGKRFLSSASDGSVALWDVSSGDRLRTYHHQDQVRSAFFTGDDRYVLTCTMDMTLSLWSTDRDEAIYTMRARGPGLMMADLSPDGGNVALSTTDQFFQVWNTFGTAGMQPVAYPLPQRTNASCGVRQLEFSSNKNRFGVSWVDSTYAVFDTVSLTTLAQYLCPAPFRANYLAIDPEGRRVSTVIDTMTPIVWDVDSGAIQQAYRSHDAQITAITWSPDGQRIASAAGKGAVHLWDPVSGVKELEITGYETPAMGIQFSPDSAALLIGYTDGAAVLCSTATGQRLAVFEHKFPVLDVAFSSDGKRIAIATADANVNIWDLNRCELLGMLKTSGYIGKINVASRPISVAFAQNDKYIVTRSNYVESTLWDAESFVSLASFDVSDTVEFLPENRSALAVDINGVLRRIENVPWSYEKYAALSVHEAQQRYQTYKEEQTQNAKPLRQLPDTGEFFVPLGAESLIHATQALSAEVASVQTPAIAPDDDRCRISTPQSWASYCMNLQPGDRITHLNGKALSGRWDTQLRLESIAAELAKSETPSLELSFQRDERPFTYRYVTLPVTQHKMSMALPQDTAAAMLDAACALLPSCVEFCQPSPPGIAFLIIASLTPTVADIFRQANLMPGYIVTDFDGKRYSNYEELRGGFMALRQKIIDGECPEFIWLAHCGLFSELEISYTVLK